MADRGNGKMKGVKKPSSAPPKLSTEEKACREAKKEIVLGGGVVRSPPEVRSGCGAWIDAVLMDVAVDASAPVALDSGGMVSCWK